MNESEFNALAEEELGRIEVALDACGVELDLDTQPGGVLEVEFGNGSRMVINRHSAAREIWIAARTGGFHFRLENGQWQSVREEMELYTCLSRLVSEQAGVQVTLAPD